MQVIESVKQNVTSTIKMLTMWDIRNLISGVEKAKILTVCLLDLINSAAKILLPASLSKAIEICVTANQDNDQEHLFQVKLLLSASVLLSAWIRFEPHIKNYLLNTLQEKIIDDQSKQIVALSHQISLNEYLSFKPEVTFFLMEISNTHSKLPSEVLCGIYQFLIDVVAGSALIWYQYGTLVGLEFVAYCVFDLIIVRNLFAYISGSEDKYNDMNKKFSKHLNHVYEIMDYENTVRMFNHENFENDMSEIILQKYLASLNKHLCVENLSSVVKLISFLASNLIPLSFVLKEELKIANLYSFVFLFGYINSFTSNLTGLNNSFKIAFRAVNSIDKMQNMMIKADQSLQADENQLFIPLHFDFSSVPLEISFENVSFTYPQNKSPTLTNISFTVLPGQTIVIVGRSGGGKSTIINLLLYGDYQPQKGAIKINGVNIKDIPKETRCKIFCCVPQELSLFKNKSLKYNVIYGNSSNSILKRYLVTRSYLKDKGGDGQTYFDMLEQYDGLEPGTFAKYRQAKAIYSAAINKVNLHHLDNSEADKKASALPLSGGQKQRVNIARALARHSSIFLFDEPTASLDSFTECEVLRNIREVTAGKSTIMITHRLSTIQDTDEVVVLEDGAIVEKGKPSVLLEKGGFYSNYFKMQMG